MTSLEKILSTPREEVVQQYLTQNQGLLLSAFGSQWYVNECIPKFRFGADFISDFVIVSGQSFSYDVILIELEPPTARPFTKGGKYAARLNAALGQINDWMAWINENVAYFRRSVAKAMSDASGSEGPAHYAAKQLALQGTDDSFSPYGESKRWAEFISAKIIIGRRSMLSEGDNKRRSILYEQTNKRIEVVPYDRLMEMEDKLRMRGAGRSGI